MEPLQTNGSFLKVLSIKEQLVDDNKPITAKDETIKLDFLYTFEFYFDI